MLVYRLWYRRELAFTIHDAVAATIPTSRVKALDNGLQLVPRRWRRRASQDSEGDYGEEEPFGFLRGQARPTIHRTPAQVLSDLAFVRVVDAEVDVLRVDGSATDRVPRPSLERERERRSEAPLTERKHYRASPDSVLLPRLVKAKKANEAMARTKKEETANLCVLARGRPSASSTGRAEPERSHDTHLPPPWQGVLVVVQASRRSRGDKAQPKRGA